MCVFIPTQFIDYQKVTLDKEAVIIIQLKNVAKWSNLGTCNRTHLVTGKFTLFQTTRHLVFYEGLHKFSETISRSNFIWLRLIYLFTTIMFQL